MTIFLIAVAVSALICGLLIATQGWHVHVTGRREADACHELHDGEVARLGGIAVFVAGLVCLTVLSYAMTDADGRLLWSAWACLSLVTMIGLYEDLKRNLPPVARYIGTALAVMMLSMANSGLGIDSVAIPAIDALLAYKVCSVLFFTFAVTGTTHAFNLIDGQNGLSAGVASLCLAGLAKVALVTGQDTLGLLALGLAGANLGFLLFNYPFGKIFLGDCGAYLNGAAVGVLTVLVVQGSGGAVSPWFALALLAYPAWETIFSMIRRSRGRQSLFMPDVSHLHHLYFAQDQQRGGLLRYSSAPRLLLLAALPVAVAVSAYAHTLVLASTTAGFIAVYGYLYARVEQGRDAELATSSS